MVAGNNFLIAKSDDVFKVIAEAIRNNYSGEVAAHAESEEDSEMAVDDANNQYNEFQQTMRVLG